MNTELLQGPQRVVKTRATPLDTTPLLTAPATVIRTNAGGFAKAQKKFFKKKSAETKQLKANVKTARRLPSPTSPEFDSTKHGLLAPPKTRHLKDGKYID